MVALRTMPKGLLFAFAALLPVGIVYRFGPDALPVLIALFGVLLAWFAFVNQRQKLLFSTLFVCLLFSVELPILGGAALSLPAEPLAILLAATTFFALASAPTFLKSWAEQPLFWAVLFLVFAWLLSAVFSTMPAVSAKYVFINLVFIAAGFLGFSQFLQQTDFTLLSGLRLLALPAFFFAVFAVFNLLPHGFNPGAAPLIGQPFFKDHTVFSATFSLFVPLFLLWPSFTNQPKKPDWLFVLLGVLLLGALFISSSRAAWLALLLASIFYVFVRLRGGLKSLSVLLAAAIFAVWLNADALKLKLFVNPYTSTEVAGGLQDQALSVTNINSDVSNLERLNRWKCALEMGLDKPLTGFGPGTYQFQYFPYQQDADKTYISVDSPFNTILGRGGSAHSEYLLLLSESGFLGLFAWIALQVVLLLNFFTIWRGNLPQTDKNLALAIYLGCLTFTVHSLFNNYLNNAQFGLSWWFLVGALFHFSLKNKTTKHAA